MTPEDYDNAFDRAIASNIKEGLHSRRGLTTDEYVALCRKVWDDCETSPKFPFKILLDPLRSVESMLPDITDEYVHWRAADAIDALREPLTEIRCEAVGSVRPDLSTDPDQNPSPPTEEPEAPESRRYILAVF